MRTLPIHLVLCVLSLPGVADTLLGRVVKIADGDTLTLLDASNTQHKIRLSGRDAPERGQPFGTVSGAPLGKLVLGKEVRIDYDKRDRHGRIMGAYFR